MQKVYFKQQRILYAWGWFLISFLVGFFFAKQGWNVLAVLAFIFASLSLYTGYKGTNEDFKNPRLMTCPKCKIPHNHFNLNNESKSSLFTYDKIKIREKDGLHIYSLICFNCKKLTEYASDPLNSSGHAVMGIEYFKTSKISKKNLKDAIEYAKNTSCNSALKKLKRIKL